MDSSSQVAVLQNDVQELEQMNSSLLDRVAQLERELAQTRSRAASAEAQTMVVCVERDDLRKRLSAVSEENLLLQQKTSVQFNDAQQEDLRSALLDIERFESLLRVETEQRAELEARLASRQKLEVENGLTHSLEVSELESMNTMLATENASLQEKIKKMELVPQQPPLFCKPEISTEPCAEPEQDDCNIGLTQFY